MKHAITLTSTSSTNQNPPSWSLFFTLTQHTMAWGHSTIVAIFLFRDCVVNRLSVGTLTEAHIMIVNIKKQMMDVIDANVIAFLHKCISDTNHAH